MIAVSKGIEHLIATNQIFASWRLPGERDIHTITSDVVSSFHPKDHALKKGFILRPFIGNTESIKWIPAQAHFLNEEINSINLPEQESKDRIANDYFPIDKKSYLRSVNELIQEMAEHQLQKIVISRITQQDLDRSALSKLYNNLLESYPDAFVYIFSEGNGEIWIGASPERLIEYKNEVANTVALAATRKSMNERIEWTDKEKEEQALVGAYIEGILSEEGHSYEKGETKTHQLKSGLSHIITSYSFKVDKEDVFRVAERLHPTPAVCGLPVKMARERIQNYELHDRSYYTGYLGPINFNDDVHLFVNLRCACHQDLLNLFVGGGLLKSSNAESEWKEGEYKSRTILDMVDSGIKL